MKQNTQRAEGPVPPGWTTASFRIHTVDGWLDVDGIVRPPFGIDQRSIDQAGNTGWIVTHLPSGLTVVIQVRALAVALALVDRIASLPVDALRERAVDADRLPVLPQDAPPAPGR